MRRFGGILAAVVLTLALGAGAAAYQIRPNAGDRALARSSVLKKADLPSGLRWKAGAPRDDDSSPRCAGYDPKTSDLVQTASAGSEFTAPGAFLGDEVDVLATPRMVETDFERTFVAKVAPCLADMLGKAGHGKITVLSSRRVPFPRLAPDVAAYRLIFHLTLKGRELEGVFDFVALGGNRTEVSLAFLVEGLSSEISSMAQLETGMSAIEDALTATLARRALGDPNTGNRPGGLTA